MPSPISVKADSCYNPNNRKTRGKKIKCTWLFGNGNGSKENTVN